MATRLDKTLTDYVVIAISPALIMTLVGSLVYFLVEICYQGDYHARLLYVLSLFVFAAVLIGRIAIEEGKERAMMFGIALALVVALALNRFVEYPNPLMANLSWLINLGLMGITWWCAHKLVFDCTLIDEREDASGEGLLQVAGIDAGTAGDRDVGAARASANTLPPVPPVEPEGTTSAEWNSAPWWERLFDPRPKAHAPGLWVVYFSLAALPIFGIGQLFIPTDEVGRRRYVFCLLCVYMASGLGLLLTTSFLGLRRYLRQRRLEMPPLMANTWLGVGSILIVALLLVALLIPRPGAEYAISQLPEVWTSGEQQASAKAVLRDSASESQDRSATPGSQSAEAQQEPVPNRDAAGDQTGGDHPGQTSDKAETDASENKDAAGETQRDETSADSRQAQKSGDKNTSGGASGEKGSGNQRGDEGSRQQARSDRSASKEPGKPDDRSQSKGPQADGKTSEPSRQQSATPPESHSQPQSFRAPPLPSLNFSGLAKWAFYLVAGCAVLFFLWRSREEVLRFLQDLWDALAGLWGGGGRSSLQQSGDEKIEIRVPPPPFSTFVDPFASGKRLPPTELVRYTFEAFEAWARDHGFERAAHETPHELARRVSAAVASVAPGAKALADIYSRVAYAGEQAGPANVAPLGDLWQAMRTETPDAWQPVR